MTYFFGISSPEQIMQAVDLGELETTSNSDVIVAAITIKYGRKLFGELVAPGVYQDHE